MPSLTLEPNRWRGFNRSISQSIYLAYRPCYHLLVVPSFRLLYVPECCSATVSLTVGWNNKQFDISLQLQPLVWARSRNAPPHRTE